MLKYAMGLMNVGQLGDIFLTTYPHLCTEPFLIACCSTCVCLHGFSVAAYLFVMYWQAVMVFVVELQTVHVGRINRAHLGWH